MSESYKVFAALHEDINEGGVWLSEHDCKRLDIQSRDIVKITFTKRRFGCLWKAPVYCQAHIIDDNFCKYYGRITCRNIDLCKKAHPIVINDWYRKKLGGLETFITTETEEGKPQIKPTCKCINPWYWFRYGIGHPQAIVKLATWLSVISVGLGITSIFLAIRS